jgi:hypothetical protein
MNDPGMSPAQQLAAALYVACGKPRHLANHAVEWTQIADKILADPRYEFETVLGAIRWLPSNKFWLGRCTTMQKFRQSIDAVLSEYLVSPPSVVTRDPRLSQLYNIRAEARKELSATFDCPDCKGSRVVDGGRSCPTCYDKELEIHRRLFREREALRKKVESA